MSHYATGLVYAAGGGVVDSASDEIVKEFTSAHSAGVAQA
jgi:hypothetical protein